MSTTTAWPSWRLSHSLVSGRLAGADRHGARSSTAPCARFETSYACSQKEYLTVPASMMNIKVSGVSSLARSLASYMLNFSYSLMLTITHRTLLTFILFLLCRFLSFGIPSLLKCRHQPTQPLRSLSNRCPRNATQVHNTAP